MTAIEQTPTTKAVVPLSSTPSSETPTPDTDSKSGLEVNLTSRKRGGVVCTPGQGGQGSELKNKEETWPSAPLDVGQAAAYLNVNERYVRQLVTERKIAFLKVGRLLRFQVVDLDAYLKSCRVEPFAPRATGSSSR